MQTASRRYFPKSSVTAVSRVLLLGLLFAPFRTPTSQTRPQLALVDVTIVDSTGAAPRPDMTVVITGERISGIGPSVHMRVPSGAQVVDARGKFLIPGLWDMHVHLAQAGIARWSRAVILPLLVANGVTGVRDMGGDLEFIQALRRDIAAGKLLGPRIVAAGAAVDGPPTRTSRDVISVATAAEGRKVVISQKRGGADFIKVLSLVPRDGYFAIARQANKEHLPFAGHVPEAVSVVEASQAGQNSMEHLTGIFLNCSGRERQLRAEVLEGIRKERPFVLERIGNHLPPRQAIDSYDEKKCGRVFAALARNHTWQVPTLVSQWAFSVIAGKRAFEDPAMKYIPAGLQKAGEEVDFKKLQGQDVRDLAEYFEKSTPLVRRMKQAGVPFLAGTDAPYPPEAGFSLHQELELLVRAGLTPLEALQSATLNPAEFLNESHSLGSIAPGKSADLVLLDANPLENIANTQKINSVIVRGKYLSRSTLDEILSRVQVAAKSGS